MGPKKGKNGKNACKSCGIKCKCAMKELEKLLHSKPTENKTSDISANIDRDRTAVLLDNLFKNKSDAELREANEWLDIPLLVLASSTGHTAGVKKLLQIGVDVDVCCKSDGNTALILATKGDHLKTMRALLEAGANPGIGNKEGNNAFMTSIAASFKYQSLHLIWEYKLHIDIDQADSLGLTPLMLAVLRNWEVVVVFLLDNNANTSHISKAGQTALTLACMKGCKAIISRLLSAGVFPLQETRVPLGRNMTALCLAIVNKHDNIADLLMSRLSLYSRDCYIADQAEKLSTCLRDITKAEAKSPVWLQLTEDLKTNILPVWCTLNTKSELIPVIFKANVLVLFLGILQQCMEVEKIVKNTVWGCCQLLYDPKKKVNYSFMNDFVKYDGLKISLKLIEHYNSVGDDYMTACCMYPLLFMAETSFGVSWLTKHYHLLIPYLHCLESGFFNWDVWANKEFAMKTKAMKENFKESVLEVQAVEAEKVCKQLLLWEEYEKTKKAEKDAQQQPEKKKRKRRKKSKKTNNEGQRGSCHVSDVNNEVTESQKQDSMNDDMQVYKFLPVHDVNSNASSTNPTESCQVKAATSDTKKAKKLEFGKTENLKQIAESLTSSHENVSAGVVSNPTPCHTGQPGAIEGNSQVVSQEENRCDDRSTAAGYESDIDQKTLSKKARRKLRKKQDRENRASLSEDVTEDKLSGLEENPAPAAVESKREDVAQQKYDIDKKQPDGAKKSKKLRYGQPMTLGEFYEKHTTQAQEAVPLDVESSMLTEIPENCSPKAINQPGEIGQNPEENIAKTPPENNESKEEIATCETASITSDEMNILEMDDKISESPNDSELMSQHEDTPDTSITHQQRATLAQTKHQREEQLDNFLRKRTLAAAEAGLEKVMCWKIGNTAQKFASNVQPPPIQNSTESRIRESTVEVVGGIVGDFGDQEETSLSGGVMEGWQQLTASGGHVGKLSRDELKANQTQEELFLIGQAPNLNDGDEKPSKIERIKRRFETLSKWQEDKLSGLVVQQWSNVGYGSMVDDRGWFTPNNKPVIIKKIDFYNNLSGDVPEKYLPNISECKVSNVDDLVDPVICVASEYSEVPQHLQQAWEECLDIKYTPSCNSKHPNMWDAQMAIGKYLMGSMVKEVRNSRWRKEIEIFTNSPPQSLSIVGDIIISDNPSCVISSRNNGCSVVIGLLKDGTPCAVKRIPIEKFENIQAALINILSSVSRNKCLVQVYAITENETFGYMAMELCNEDIESWITRHSEAKKQDHLMKLTQQFVEALQYLHHHCNMLHRNLKPHNLLVDVSGNLKLTDYGVDRFTGPLSTSVRNLNLGRIPSKCWHATEAPDQSVDLYTAQAEIQIAGMLIHYMQSYGQHPFGRNLFDIQINITRGWPQWQYFNDEVNDLLRGMLAGDPAQRMTIDDVVKHPVFWDAGKRCSFLMNLGKCLGTPEYKPIEDKLMCLSHQAVCKDWMKNINSSLLAQMEERCHVRNTAPGLLKLLHQTKEAYTTLTADVQLLLGINCIYFLNTYKNLFMPVYRVIQTDPKWLRLLEEN